MKSTQTLSPRFAMRLFTLVAILLLASALRARDLSLMTTMLHYDEAYYGVDALSLIAQPRLTPFFAENFGRESLWMYTLTPALAAFGSTAFALRITAFFTSVLTVAAVYRLGRELFNAQAGTWAAAVLAVLFWHVLAGHQSFRAHLYPLVGALAFALLLHAPRVDTWRAWVWAGIAFGTLAYTYIAARGWLVLGAGVAGWWVVAGGHQDSGRQYSGRPMGRPYTSPLSSSAPLRFHLNFSVMSVPLRFNPKPLLAIISAALIAFPLLIELLANPALAGQRTEQVSIRTVEQLAENLTLWARAWFIEGSHDVAYTLPGRPILDPPLVILVIITTFAAILVAAQKSLFKRVEKKRIEDQGFIVAEGLTAASPLQKPSNLFPSNLLNKHFSSSFIFLLILASASLAPAVLTTDTLKPLRAVGVVVPLAIAMGVGICRLQESSQRRGDPPGRPYRARNGVLGMFLPIILFAWAGVNTARDVSAWVRGPDLYLPMEQHVYRGIDALRTLAPPDAPVYFAPFTPAHPVIRFRQSALAPRPISALEPGECVRVPNAAEAYYFALTLFDPGFADRLRPYAVVDTAATEPGDIPRWTIFRAQPDEGVFREQGVVFGERIAVRLERAPAQMSASASVSLTAIVRAIVPLERAYTLFVHVYGDPTPYEGGALWGQADAPLCTSSPPQTWRTDEIIIQPVTLTVAADLPAGEYDLAVGVYDTLTGERLPLADGATYALVGGVTSP